MAVTYDVVVRRQPGSRRWGVYGIATYDAGGRDEQLLEGGFFSRGPADRAARVYMGEVAAEAERKAGWDPNP